MIISVLKNTIMITSFVLVIMLTIEFINVQSRGNWLSGIEKHKWLQYFITAFMGIIPGCVGTFGVVSLYIHNMISFGALLTALIATFGDEAFVMFALIPGTTIKLSIIIIIIGIIAGVAVDLIMKRKPLSASTEPHFEIHNTDHQFKSFQFGDIFNNIKNMSFPRGALLGGVILILIGIVAGEFSDFQGHNIWGWEQISFFLVMIFGLFIIVFVSEHFLEDHLWKHVVKKHFVRIFLWTFGALLLIGIFKTYLHWDAWIKSNQLIILILAVLIGVIPESGPHLIFVTLFINGSIPFGTLLASSIVQDGHGALPLLAESKKSFFFAKAINIFIGLVVGLIGIYL
jgi:MFS family permease